MRILSIVFYLIGFGSLPFAFEQATKPSAIPIAAVVGAFVIPALFIWWGAILWKKSSQADSQ